MSSLLLKIYSKMPVHVQNFGISLFGIKWYNRRFGGIYRQELNKYLQRERFSDAEWKHYKNGKLRALLKHAYENVPYYNDLFNSNKIKHNQIELNNLNIIPFLEKQTLRVYGQTQLISKLKEPRGEFFSSSGSTGTPTQILISSLMHQRYAAAHESRCRAWAGVNNKSPRGMIGGRKVLTGSNEGPPFHRFNIIEKQVYFSAYHISSINTYNYVKAMYKHNIEYMTGYAVSNYLLALNIKQQKIKAPKLKAVITSSEKLTSEMRNVMEEVYQCKVFDGWSGVEACAMVTECEYGNLHISEDVGIIEILDEHGNEVSEGESGEVVCTGFLNYDQPLIRYRIGDRMTKGTDKCSCGRNMPIIKEIDGRIEDVVTGPDGRKMVRFHSVFIGIPSIEFAQVIQEEIDYILIKIQNEIKLTDKEIELIKYRVLSQLGDVKIDIHQQTKIEQKNGKYKAVISKLKYF